MKKPLQEEPTKHVQTSSASCAGNKSNASQPPRPRVDLSEPPPAVLLIFTDSEDKQKRNNNKRTRRTEGAKGVVRPSSHRRLAVWLVAFQPTNQLAPPAHAASDWAPETHGFRQQSQDATSRIEAARTHSKTWLCTAASSARSAAGFRQAPAESQVWFPTKQIAASLPAKPSLSRQLAGAGP